MIRTACLWSLTVVIAAGCQTTPGPSAQPLPLPSRAAPKPGPTANPGPARLPAFAAQLVGLNGATLINLDAGSLVGLNGATLVGANGATLVSSEGGPGSRGGRIPLLPAGGVAPPPGPLAPQAGVFGDETAARPVPAATGSVVVPAALLGVTGGERAPAPGTRLYLQDAAGRFVVTDGAEGVAIAPWQAATAEDGSFTLPATGESPLGWLVLPIDSRERALRLPLYPEQPLPLRLDAAGTMLSARLSGRWAQRGTAPAEGLTKLSGEAWAAAHGTLQDRIDRRALPLAGLDWSPSSLAARLEAEEGRDASLQQVVRALLEAL